MSDPWKSKQSGLDLEPPEAPSHRDSRLEQANDELRRANKELEEFAYVASHDLREPLRMINIYTQLLAERYGGALDDQGRQFVRQVEYNVGRMEALIHDVLEYSRTIHDEKEVPLTPVSLRESLDQALDLFRDQLETVAGSVEVGELPLVAADGTQMSLVFQNLLSNSLKYAHRGRALRVRIWAESRGDLWAIHVADNGVGFEPEFAERIFGLFKRLHGREVPGTGLGLAICRRIIERSGGQIWAESTAMDGAEFIFTLKGWTCHGSSAANSAS